MNKRQTPKPQNWHEVGELLGLPPLPKVRLVKTCVNMGAMDRIKAQIQRDRDSGLIPPKGPA